MTITHSYPLNSGPQKLGAKSAWSPQPPALPPMVTPSLCRDNNVARWRETVYAVGGCTNTVRAPAHTTRSTNENWNRRLRQRHARLRR